MRLSLVNLFKRTVNGHIFRGKNRLVKPVTKHRMESLIKEYELQERNMLFLRHPYLSLAESSGHAKDLKKREKLIEKWQTEKTLSKMKPHVTIEDRLSHLAVKDSWE